METIEISRDNALAALQQADSNLKPILQQLLGINPTPTTWQEIKTFEQACKIVPPDMELSPILNYSGSNKDFKAAVALAKLTIVSRAMNKLNNDGKVWEPNWADSNEYKYYPWLKYEAGSGFSDDDYNFGRTASYVGSRLCFMTSDMARHAAVHFEALYNDLFTF